MGRWNGGKVVNTKRRRRSRRQLLREEIERASFIFIFIIAFDCDIFNLSQFEEDLSQKRKGKGSDEEKNEHVFKKEQAKDYIAGDLHWGDGG